MTGQARATAYRAVAWTIAVATAAITVGIVRGEPGSIADDELV